MRHLGSLALTIVLAPIVCLLIGFGQGKLSVGFAPDHTKWSTVAVALAALLGAGVCYALLTLTRLSPIGPVLAGAVYIGVSVVAMAKRGTIYHDLDHSVLGVHHATLLPITSGVLIFAALPLLATMFSGRRWRAREREEYGGAYTSGADYSTWNGAPQYETGPYSADQTGYTTAPDPFAWPDDTTVRNPPRSGTDW
jgi:hypothetical protein